MNKKSNCGVEFRFYHTTDVVDLLNQAGVSRGDLQSYYRSLHDTLQQLSSAVLTWPNERKADFYRDVMRSFVIFLSQSATQSTASCLHQAMFEVLIKQNAHTEKLVFDVVVHAFTVDFDVYQSAYSFLLPFFPKSSLN